LCSGERITDATSTCHMRTELKGHSPRLDLRSSYPSDVVAPAHNDSALTNDVRTFIPRHIDNFYSRARSQSATISRPRLGHTFAHNAPVHGE
jgi:hypothetical protein